MFPGERAASSVTLFNTTLTCLTHRSGVTWLALAGEAPLALDALRSIEAWFLLALVNVCRQHTYTHTRTGYLLS